MTKKEIRKFIENGLYSSFSDGRGQTAYGENTVIRIVNDILKQAKNNGDLDSVILCDAPDKILPCRHKCFSQCQLRGHCNYQKHEV